MKPLLSAWTCVALLGCGVPTAPSSLAPPPPAMSPPPAVSTPPAPPEPPEPLSTSCGALALRRAALAHQGKGKAHPEMLRVDAGLRTCTADAAADARACVEIHAKRLADEALGLGPRHPSMVSASAQLALCEGWLGPDLVPPPNGSDAPIARLSWNDLVNGARNVGWKSVNLGSAGGMGYDRYTAFLTKKDHRRASLFAFDFPPDADLTAARVGRSQAMHVQTRRRLVLGAKSLEAREVLDSLAGRAPLGFPTRDELTTAAANLPLGGSFSDGVRFSLVDGLWRTYGDLGAANTSVEVLLLDYRVARAEGRVLVDGHRVLVVSVCDACSGGEHVGLLEIGPSEGKWNQEEARALTAGIAAYARAAPTR